jgi:hypothetical protein
MGIVEVELEMELRYHTSRLPKDKNDYASKSILQIYSQPNEE